VQQILQQFQHPDRFKKRPPAVSVSPSQQATDVMEERPPAASVPPSQQATDVENVVSEKMVSNEEMTQDIALESIALEKPAPDAPRRAETVIALVEFLRDQRYTPQERPRELRAAYRLLTLQPELSLTEIEEAWLHGSDDYWRDTHGGDDVHVHDLFSQDSHGKYRVLAFLAHKRAQERRASQQTLAYSSCYSRGRTGVPAPSQRPPSPPKPQPSLSEEQANGLVERIAQQANEHGYTLSGTPEQQGEEWTVRVVWSSPYWRKSLNLVICSVEQWNKEFAEWHETVQCLHSLALKRKRKGV
jgi:hypothetical protein